MSIFIFALILFVTEIIDVPVYVFIIPFLFIYILKPKCPKCGSYVGSDKNGMTSINFSKNCEKCGQDLIKCKAEKKKGKK